MPVVPAATMLDTTTTSFACTRCGLRQERGDRCTSCRHDCVLDLRDNKNVEFLRESDRKRRRAHVDRTRRVAVGIATALVIATWFIPGFWAARAHLFAPPLMLDQLLVTALVGGLLWKVLERWPPQLRFPYLAER